MKFSLNKIYFIVSLEDEQMAKSLYEDIVARGCDRMNLQHEYRFVTKKKELKLFLNKIIYESNKKNMLPYIHIEAHGSENHLALCKGMILFSELAKYFAKINIFCKCNLVVSMAACFGVYFEKEMITKISKGKKTRTPIFGVVGPNNITTYGILEKGFTNYFNELFNSGDIIASSVALNNASTDGTKFYFMTAEACFYKVIEKVIDILFQRFNDRDQFIEYINEFSALFNIKKNQVFDRAGLIKLIEFICNKDYFINTFSEIRKYYFLIDIYPEMESRFINITDIEHWEESTQKLRGLAQSLS